MSNRTKIIQHCSDYSHWKSEGLKKAKERGNNVGFGILFNGFAKLLPKLKGAHLNVYIYLLLHAKTSTGDTNVSIETIARDLDVSDATVKRSLNHLASLNLIHRARCGINESSWTVLGTYDYVRGVCDTNANTDVLAKG